MKFLNVVQYHGDKRENAKFYYQVYEIGPQRINTVQKCCSRNPSKEMGQLRQKNNLSHSYHGTELEDTGYSYYLC